MKARSSKVIKRRLSPETLEPIRQRGIARAAANGELTSELVKQFREAIKEDLRERRAAAMAETTAAANSIHKAHRSFANYKTKMIALRRPKGRVTASGKAMEKIIHEYYSDLFIQSLTKSHKNDAHEERIGFVCPIRVQWNEYLPVTFI
ncbi:unnamed protein product [Angiostrongylus costaricensis]|uniref:Uncharacterized protein n=1 Tax=Angiostrongylus costaricensis TaxID=334426 RepID=A0A0R3PBR2_ANGCS|nr:unnamed protein product [Angiostrongylus costaricensis]